MDQVEVWRGAHGDPAPLFGPLPGIRLGDTLAYEFQLPDSFTPWPGRTLLERVFVLLDLGVSMSIPAWRSSLGTDRAQAGPTTWYVDLVHVSTIQDSITVRDLYIDVLVPTDGRHQRLLDLDEFADAIEAGHLDIATAIDGLRRWQRFLDRHPAHRPRPQSNLDRLPTPAAQRSRGPPQPAGPHRHRTGLTWLGGPWYGNWDHQLALTQGTLRDLTCEAC